VPSGFAEAAGSVKGSAGVARLRRYAAYHASGAAAGSEMLLHDGLRRRGIGGWKANALLRLDGGPPMNVDLLFEAAKLIVEVDGYGFHSGREAFERDRQRDRRATRAGYRVIRFTWRDVSECLDRVLDEVEAHLLAR
jgi:very-short-patch-repair endonuclease